MRYNQLRFQFLWPYWYISEFTFKLFRYRLTFTPIFALVDAFWKHTNVQTFMVSTKLAVSASFFGNFTSSIGVANPQVTLSHAGLSAKKVSAGRTSYSSIAWRSIDCFVITNFTFGNNLRSLEVRIQRHLWVK